MGAVGSGAVTDTTTVASGPRFEASAVWLGMFALGFWISHTMLRPLLGPYAAGLGLSASSIGVIIGVQAVPAVLFAIPLGAALDRSGARRILAAGAVLMLAGGAVMLVADDAATLVAAQVVLGFGTLGVWLTIQSLVTFAARDPSQRGRSIANYSVCIVTGQLLGPLLGGAVADAFGYRASFAVFSALCLGLVTAALIRDADHDFGVRSTGTPDRRRSSHRDAFTLLTSRAVRLTVAVSFLALFLVDLRMTFVPVFLDGVGWSPALIGVLLSTSSACALLARPLFPVIIGRFGPATAVAVCLLPGAAALGLLTLTTSTPWLFAIAAVAGVSLGLAQPLTLSLTAEYTGPAQRGLAVALRVLANRLALWLSPMLFGLLVTVVGVQAAFLTGTGVLAVLAAGIAARFRKLPGPEPARRS